MTEMNKHVGIDSYTDLLNAKLARAWDEGLAAGLFLDFGDYEHPPEPYENPYRKKGGEVTEACRCFSHGPFEPCTCNGCWTCRGRVDGCTCDINWDCEHREENIREV